MIVYLIQEQNITNVLMKLYKINENRLQSQLERKEARKEFLDTIRKY